MFTAIEAVGGLFIVPAAADPELVRQAVLAEGTRALEVQSDDLAFLAGLPLEFLVLNVAMPRIAPVNGLYRLRGLVANAWTGDLDFEALPELEWFEATEADGDQLARLFVQGHQRLHHLAVGRYYAADLTPLSGLPALTHLSIGDSRKLAHLAGIERLPGLKLLEVYSSPALASLAGIEAATSLRHLEVDRCNRILRLDEVAALPGLRSLQIEMDRPPPLAPFIGHPQLAYLWLVGGRKSPADEISRLLETPSLCFLAAGRRAWLRDGTAGWLHVPDIYAMNDEAAILHERLVRERDAFALW